MDLNKILEVCKGGFSPDLGVLKGVKIKIMFRKTQNENIRLSLFPIH